MVEYMDRDEGESMQYNIIFSQSFGKEPDLSSDEEFFDYQYLVVQQYNEEVTSGSYGIFKLNYMYEPIHT